MSGEKMQILHANAAFGMTAVRDREDLGLRGLREAV